MLFPPGEPLSLIATPLIVVYNYSFGAGQDSWDCYLFGSQINFRRSVTSLQPFLGYILRFLLQFATLTSVFLNT
jgi:hypothetical protein